MNLALRGNNCWLLFSAKEPSCSSREVYPRSLRHRRRLPSLCVKHWCIWRVAARRPKDAVTVLTLRKNVKKTSKNYEQMSSRKNPGNYIEVHVSATRASADTPININWHHISFVFWSTFAKCPAIIIDRHCKALRYCLLVPALSFRANMCSFLFCVWYKLCDSMFGQTIDFPLFSRHFHVNMRMDSVLGSSLTRKHMDKALHPNVL